MNSTSTTIFTRTIHTSNKHCKSGTLYLISICILLLLFLLAGAGTACAAIITVDDNGGAGHTTIQAAINTASAGDEIHVYSGTYYENVNVTKQLTLRGIGMPVVNASGSRNAITLSADGIILDEFTVIGSGNYPEAGIKVISNNNILTGNNASSNKGRGIHLQSSSNNTLIGNNASSNYFNGIYLEYSSNNSLISNNASNNEVGIFLEYSSNNNTLSGNNASNNDIGIFLGSSSNNTLMSNNASSNYYSGIILGSSSNNTLNGNNANSNDNFGIELSSSSNNTLKSNNASLNNGNGIYLDSSSNNTLSGNNASTNNFHGINLSSSSNNTIYNNFFNNTNNVRIIGLNVNSWNITLQSGTNIIGGPTLGGNFWTHPDGTGISQTCGDDNGDGICNSNYTINSNNIDYLPLTATQPGTQNILIQLYSGWNLISLPLMPENSNIESALSTINGNYSIVRAYNASDTNDHWKEYDTEAFFGNDLTSMVPGKGYLIMMNSDDILNVSGTIPAPTDIDLFSGWNLIGYNSLYSQPITDAFSSIN